MANKTTQQMVFGGTISKAFGTNKKAEQEGGLHRVGL